MLPSHPPIFNLSHFNAIQHRDEFRFFQKSFPCFPI